jgi:hypothetical protein
MFAITAAIAAFFISLLVIASMVDVINEQHKTHIELVKKNNLLMAELRAAENVAGLKADFEAILSHNEECA